MPIYEYQCDNCQHQFEVMQKINDAKLQDCPECQQASLRRLVSMAGFQLKGTGWYATDFKNNHKGSNTTSAKTDEKSTSACAHNQCQCG